MKKIGTESLILKVGWFNMKVDDIVIFDILRDSKKLCDHLHFTSAIRGEGDDITVAAMVEDLKSRGYKIDEKIQKLILSGFFNLNLGGLFHQIFSQVGIIKGRAALTRNPSVLIRDGFPSDFFLIPPEITFQVAYIVSRIISKEFLNIHNMDRIYIMSKPLEKLDEHDDNLIVVFDPSYFEGIHTDLYNDMYGGDKNVGYLFFTI